MDGEDAMAFLRKEGQYSAAPNVDLVLLDLNLPRKNGGEVLSEIKTNKVLRTYNKITFTLSVLDT